uniref:hypothetical protein n=3 Tax=Pseudomonas aeruginosa TaxID=287 RepID=UPI000ADC8AAB
GITVRMRVEWVSESAWNPHFGADLINCGHFSMPDAVAGMLGFVLEAERLMCLIDGQGESELQGLQALPAKRETQPRLKLVK